MGSRLGYWLGGSIPPWGRTRTSAHTGSWSLTDSPVGRYRGGIDISATLAEPISLLGANSPVLAFWHRYQLDDFDDAVVEAQVGDGEWREVAYYWGGAQEDWERVEISLEDFAGMPEVRFRFRLHTAVDSPGGDGWYIDDVAILGVATTCEACDGEGACEPVADGTPCPDGNACNGDEVCTAGECAAPAPLYCDDGDICSQDECDPEHGCVHTPTREGLPCSSLLVCGGVCRGGRCTGDRPASCDDNNDCTEDSCNVAANECANRPRPDGTPCEDGNQCTAGGRCTAGTCTGGTEVICEDGNACIADWCDPAAGCRRANVADGTGCDDDNVCTEADSCRAGVCAGTVAPGKPCDDGDETTIGDVCRDDGTCLGTPLPEERPDAAACECRVAAPNSSVTLLGVLAVLAALLATRRRRS